jgi:hypothetical protein
MVSPPQKNNKRQFHLPLLTIDCFSSVIEPRKQTLQMSTFLFLKHRENYIDSLISQFALEEAFLYRQGFIDRVRVTNLLKTL